MKRQALAAGITALVVLAIAGCSTSRNTAGTVSPTTASPPTLAPGSTTSTTAVTAGSVSPSSSSPTSSPARPTGPTGCATSQLEASLDSGTGTAGTVYYQLSLRNTGHTTCLEQGYPGVSFVAGADGHQVGAAASRDPGSGAPLITLAPGDAVSATLGVVDAGNFPSDCNRTPVLGLRVYPPNQRTALFVAHRDYACANTKYVTIHIAPLQATS